MEDNNRANPDAIIHVGDKVDLVIQSGLVYRAMIEDRLENGPFLIAVPSRRGIPMSVNQDGDIYLVFYRESGRYIAQMKIVALERRGEIRYMWVLQKTPAQKNQRREAFRLPVSFNVQIFEHTDDMERSFETGAGFDASAIALETADCRDLSITGIALITKMQYTLEEQYILVMHMENTPKSIRAVRPVSTTPPLELTASVKRSIPWRESKKFNTGMQFFGMTASMSEDIAKFVLIEQQRQIKMRRLG